MKKTNCKKKKKKKKQKKKKKKRISAILITFLFKQNLLSRLNITMTCKKTAFLLPLHVLTVWVRKSSNWDVGPTGTNGVGYKTTGNRLPIASVKVN